MIHLEAFGRTPYRRAVRKEISSRPGPFGYTPMGSRTAAGPRLKTNTHPPAYFFPFARTHMVFELVHSNAGKGITNAGKGITNARTQRRRVA